MKVVFTGGGSGGHIFPLVAVAREIRRLYTGKDLQLHYLGPKDELADIYLRQEDFIIQNMVAGKVRRYFSFKNVVDILWNMPVGFIQSFWILGWMSPKLVFSKGGTGSIQVTLAAWLLGIPVFIHESDSVPGRSNQKAAKWAQKIFTSFATTSYFDPRKVTCVGNPIRKEALEGDKLIAKNLFNLTLQKPIILFMGGSQGAEAINDFVLNVVNDLLKNYEVLHVTGQLNYKDVAAESQVVIDKELLPYYHAVAFLDEEQVRHAYAAADLIVSRAGSGSIFEIAATGKASMLVPLPGAPDQPKNAYQYAENGAALVVEQDNLTPHFFLENVQILFLNSGKLEAMRAAALQFAKPLAARAVAREILQFLTLD